MVSDNLRLKWDFVNYIVNRDVANEKEEFNEGFSKRNFLVMHFSLFFCEL